MEEISAFRRQLETHRPADWETLPDFPLYMDQVLSYMERQTIRLDESDALTASMVNNYTKNALVPRAEGKKYNRDHLAYLTFVCILKQVMSVRDMDLLIRTELSDDRSVENGYRAFLESLDGALSSAVQEMGAYEGTDNLADAAVHFGLLSYAAGLVSRQYVAQLRARTEPAGKPDKSLSLQMGDRTYRNYLDGREIGFHEFYERVRSGELATTSAVNVGEFEEKMREILKTGKDILSISFSSALSTTYQSSVIAAEELKDEFPDAKILTVDSLCASLGQGLFVYLCAQEQKKGKTIDEVKTFAEETKGRVCHWFTVDDLNHLKRGGRINAATALFGTMLAIKPVMHVDDEGRLIPVSKARGRKASLTALVDRMEATAIDPAGQTVFISHGDCLEDAEFVAGEVRRRLGVETVHINYVGPVIGNHSGPGTMALFFLGSER